MSAAEDETAGLVDERRTACLCNAGSPDYLAAVCVTEDGGEVMWLLHRGRFTAARPIHGDSGVPVHERIGRLPGHVRERIWGDGLRCGRDRSNGLPCRHRVKEPGLTCRLHEGTTR